MSHPHSLPAEDSQDPAPDDQLEQAGRLLAHLQTQLAELDRRELNLNQQMAALVEQQRSAQRATAATEKRTAELQQQLDERDATVAQKETELQHRLDEFEQRIQAHAQQEESFQRERQAFVEERERAKAELLQERNEHRQAMAEAEEQLEQARREQQRIQEEWLRQQEQERARQREELEQLRKQRLTALDQREQELEQRVVDIEKRARFHEQHLEKVRYDLNARQAELERQRQQQRVWIEEVEASIRMRLGHMRRFRDLVSHREQCLAEGQRLFAEQRQAAEQALAQARTQLEESQRQWRQQRAKELELFKDREERLERELSVAESGREELDILNGQLQETIHAFRASWPALSEKLSDESSLRAIPTQGIQEPSTSLSEHLHKLTEILDRQLDELDHARRESRRRFQEQRDEGISLSAWIEEREQRLQGWGTALEVQLRSLESREQESHAAREQWQADRMQAEQVIRDLVTQLETALDEIARLQSRKPPDELAADKLRSAA